MASDGKTWVLRVAVLAAAAACAPSTQPVVDQVSPAGGDVLKANTVTFDGAGFMRSVVYDMDTGAASVTGLPRVQMVGPAQTLEITTVDVTGNGTQMTVTVPAGVAAGAYDFIVVNPDGRETRIDGAYLAIDAAMIVVKQEQGVVPTHTGTIELQDSMGLEAVGNLWNFEIQLTADVAGASFTSSTITFAPGDTSVSYELNHTVAEAVTVTPGSLATLPGDPTPGLGAEIVTLDPGPPFWVTIDSITVVSPGMIPMRITDEWFNPQSAHGSAPITVDWFLREVVGSVSQVRTGGTDILPGPFPTGEGDTVTFQPGEHTVLLPLEAVGTGDVVLEVWAPPSGYSRCFGLVCFGSCFGGATTWQCDPGS